MSSILFGLVCLWVGYRWGTATAFAREYERKWEREDEEFLDSLRAGTAS